MGFGAFANTSSALTYQGTPDPSSSPYSAAAGPGSGTGTATASTLGGSSGRARRRKSYPLIPLLKKTTGGLTSTELISSWSENLVREVCTPDAQLHLRNLLTARVRDAGTGPGSNAKQASQIRTQVTQAALTAIFGHSRGPLGHRHKANEAENASLRAPALVASQPFLSAVS